MLFYLWTLAIFTLGYLITMPVVFAILGVTLESMELLPAESVVLLGVDSSSSEPNYLLLLLYFALAGVHFLSGLGVVTQAVTRIKSEAMSFRNNIAPFIKKKGVKNMNSKISWIKFALPFEAIWKIGLSGGIFLSLSCFSVATLFSGYVVHSLCYAVAAFIFYHLTIQIMGNTSVMGFGVQQLAKDAQAISRNYALAKAQEDQMAVYNRALADKQRKHQERLAKEHNRNLARKRDMDRRRSERRKNFAAGLGAFISSVKDLF